MELFKRIITTVLAALLATLQSVHDAASLLLFLFAVNLLAGIVADVIMNRNRFCFKKFIWACCEFLIYMGIICSIFIVGHFQGDHAEALYAIKVISYLFVYAYATNTLKNMLLIRPQNMALKFLYFCLSMAFIKRIPYFQEFLKQEQNVTTD
jgi:hypothetical protein